MISRLLRFSFSTVRAEPWPVPCCLHVTGLLLLRARAGPPERHFLPRGPRPPGAPHYLSRHVLARTCWVMGRTTPLRLLPSSSRSDSGPLSPIYAARQQRRAAQLPAPIQMCDALALNTSGEFKTIVANCLTHSRRKYVDV